jgi:hypothetical protein
VALYSEGEMLFWRVLAYLAVFHFVRQQYGWVALYRAKGGEHDRTGRWIDNVTIYLATIYPLVYWHANLPRRFWWFQANDWQIAPGTLLAETLVTAERVLQPIYWTALIVYAGKALHQWVVVGRPNPGKDIVVATTVFCWYLGIVWFNSDYAFTVTNVIIHGVPYFALVFWYWRLREPTGQQSAGRTAGWLVLFLAALWLLAYVEELFWHRGVWGDRINVFGQPWDIGDWRTILVPLLAVPQVTHYVLDGFIWRRKSNPQVASLVSAEQDPQ